MQIECNNDGDVLDQPPVSVSEIKYEISETVPIPVRYVILHLEEGFVLRRTRRSEQERNFLWLRHKKKKKNWYRHEEKNAPYNFFVVLSS